MVIGTALTFPGLIVLMFAGSFPAVLVGYAIVQFFFNAAGAAYAGIIPDVVPAKEVGKASGFLATMTQLGIGGGLAVTSLMGRNTAIYLVLGCVALLSLAPTVWAARGEGETPVVPQPRRPLGEEDGVPAGAERERRAPHRAEAVAPGEPHGDAGRARVAEAEEELGPADGRVAVAAVDLVDERPDARLGSGRRAGVQRTEAGQHARLAAHILRREEQA